MKRGRASCYPALNLIVLGRPRSLSHRLISIVSPRKCEEVLKGAKKTGYDDVLLLSPKVKMSRIVITTVKCG